MRLRQRRSRVSTLTHGSSRCLAPPGRWLAGIGESSERFTDRGLIVRLDVGDLLLGEAEVARRGRRRSSCGPCRGRDEPEPVRRHVLSRLALKDQEPGELRREEVRVVLASPR